MRKWNFSAGPSVISEEVLKEVQSEVLEFKESGMSLLTILRASPSAIAVLPTPGSPIRIGLFFVLLEII